jgi:hypothetical protein
MKLLLAALALVGLASFVNSSKSDGFQIYGKEAKKNRFGHTETV